MTAPIDLYIKVTVYGVGGWPSAQTKYLSENSEKTKYLSQNLKEIKYLINQNITGIEKVSTEMSTTSLSAIAPDQTLMSIVKVT